VINAVPTQQIKTITYTLDQLDTVVNTLKSLMDYCVIFTFTGDLGAGKSTIIRKIAQTCGITEPITSPTFTYVNTYKTSHGMTINHFDCYRITTVNEFITLGFDELLHQPHSWSFIEWPQTIMPLLKTGICHVTISYDGPSKRTIHITVVPA
jgi:tRNA threonylcarbamoyladenosine biosynthesis protein TsaE